MPPANTPQITPPRSETPSARPLTRSSPDSPSPIRQRVVATETDLAQDGVEGLAQSTSSRRLQHHEFRNRRLFHDLGRMDHTTGLNRPSTTLSPHLWSDEAREDRSNAENEQRERLQRVLTRLSRRHPSAAPSYGDRAPLPTQQSLYDWAPQDQADDEQGLEDILGELRRQHPGTHSDILQFLGRRQLIRQRESDDDAARTRLPTQQSRNEPSTISERRNEPSTISERRNEPSTISERRNERLRSAAIMQNARTSVRSPSGTESMLRYLRNRERTGQRTEGEREDAEDMTSTSTPPRSAIPAASISSSRYESNRLAWQTRQPSFHNGRNQDAALDRETRRDNDARARTDAYRRGYLAENPAADRTSLTSPPSPCLEDAVAYLDCLRECSSYEDSLSAAVDHDLALKDFFADNHDDFMTSTHQCPAPPQSSLLQPGAVFEGTQNTASPRDSDDTAYRPLGLGSSSVYTNDASRAFDATRPWLSHTPTSPTTYGRMNDPWSNPYKPFQDRWPVKVIVQAVDYEKMTMAGIMEAYDVPTTTNSVAILASSSFSRTNQPGSTPQNEPSYQHSTVSKRAFPITTYLEGQIIDFSTHSFLTPAAGQSSSSRGEETALPRHQAQEITFPPTSAVTDAANWRNLPPFNMMKSDEEVARTMLSRSRMQGIMSEWIFMRWKERCFIHLKSDSCHRHEHVSSSNGVPPLGEGDDTDTGHGLTISGFYYVSLRRSDGRIEGLYFDTKTSPYQHLRLESKRSGMHGAWQFK